MKAILVHKYGGPEELKVGDAPVPQPGKTDVLIRIHAAGVNPVDTYIRAGMFGDYAKLPFVLGTDGAGVIEAVGSDVTGFKSGDRVFCFLRDQGTYAQYCICPQNRCFPLSPKLSFQQGACVGVPYFTAYRSLFQTGHSKSAKSVLVHGASGGVGLAAVQMAKAAGKTVYGTAGTETGLKLVKNAGADHVFNHREKNYVNKIMEATKDEGVDLILEMAANTNLPHDLHIIKPNGIIAVIGSRGSTTIDPGHLMGKMSAIIGVAVLNYPPDELAEAGAHIVKGLTEGSLIPVIDKEYSMNEAHVAHKEIIESLGAKGKLVILMDK